jgi:hypothetical protein
LRIYTYIIDHDLGFAPNPFHGLCTLAACKPLIRKYADLGDVIVGTGSRPNNLEGHLTYWMKVSKIIDFDQYWAKSEYRHKRPSMNGSRMQRYGDNIYHREPASGAWLQADSFHSAADGSPDPPNRARDTGTTDRVLIGQDFAYWGGEGPIIPDGLSDFVHTTQGHRCRFNQDRIDAFVQWLGSLPRPEFPGRPANWPPAG